MVANKEVFVLVFNKLNLSFDFPTENTIEDDGVARIAESLKVNENLTKLDLQSIHLSLLDNIAG
jgi:hypothetical protein